MRRDAVKKEVVIVTPIAKRIKTVRLSASATMTAGTGETVLAADMFAPQEDITLIGVVGRTSIISDASGWDSGRMGVKIEISRVGQYGKPGLILEVASNLQVREATVGINANQVAKGDMQGHEMMFFGDGYGMDFDENEPIYLHLDWQNNMANNHFCSVMAILYYLER